MGGSYIYNYHMDKEGLQRALNYLQQQHMQRDVLVTDNIPAKYPGFSGIIPELRPSSRIPDYMPIFPEFRPTSRDPGF